MKRVCAFTLIEMLVVMALAALLTAMAIPAFKALSTGSSVGETTSVIKNMLDMAQARAISSRRYVALVFDHKLLRNNPNDVQAVRLCYISTKVNDTVNADTNHYDWGYSFESWIPENPWKELNYGACLLATSASDAANPQRDIVTNGTAIKSKLSDLTELSVYKGESGSTFTAYGLIFSPYGNVRKPGSSITYTIGEAKINDSKFYYDNSDTDGKPTNLMTLQTNRFTGRTEVMTE